MSTAMNLRRPALIALLLGLISIQPVLGAPERFQRVRPLPAQIVYSTHQELQSTSRLLLDASGAGRTALLAELKNKGSAAQTRILKTMYHSMLSTMRSDLPSGQRAQLGQQLSRQFGEFAREVRKTPGMPTTARVAFGRVYHRFLRDDVLLQELAREREQQYQLSKAVPLSGLAAAPRAATTTQPQQVEVAWQVPPPVKKEELGAKPTRAVTYSLTSYKTETRDGLASYERQARRWRLVQSHTFSPAFVEKQRSAFEAEKAKLERVTKRMVSGVPRITEAKLLNAFVWPERPVRLERIVASPGSADLGRKDALWKVHKQGLELCRSPKGVQLDATFETAIDNDAVLRAFKSSIETVWSGPIKVGGSMSSLTTSVKFRRVATPDAFSPNSLRLVEGKKNCANSNRITVSRCFSSTTPAHEFGHILGLRDAYRTFYDPKARTFVEVQDRKTLMGCHTAPATHANFVSACNNVLKR